MGLETRRALIREYMSLDGVSLTAAQEILVTAHGLRREPPTRRLTAPLASHRLQVLPSLVCRGFACAGKTRTPLTSTSRARTRARVDNDDRPHMAVGGDAPIPRIVEATSCARVVALPRVDALHHRYARTA